MEVPLEANLAAMRIAKKAGAPVIFNPAPAPASLPDEVFQLSSVFCPNEHEAAVLRGMDVNPSPMLFIARGANEVVITLGERGCLLVNSNCITTIPAPKVDAVDTTGAGDAFLGSLAFYLAQGDELAEAARCACRITSSHSSAVALP
jgi:ribokinase